MRSMIAAIPWPPPMQSEASPYLPPRSRSSYASVSASRAPDAPSGWPSAMAPPFTFVLFRSRPRSFSTARYCVANASLISTRSMSLTVSPARPSASRDELRESLERRVGTDVLVLLHDHVALLLLHLDRHDLLGEAAVLARLRREAMAALREFVGRVARDAVLATEILRSVRHAESVVRVDQRDPEVVLELLLAERESPACAADLMWRHAHV